jgi:hypothetical protein
LCNFGFRRRSAKERVQPKLSEVDKKLATLKGGAALGKIVSALDPAQGRHRARVAVWQTES